MPEYTEDMPVRQKMVHVKDRDLETKYGTYGCKKLNKRNKKKKADFRTTSKHT